MGNLLPTGRKDTGVIVPQPPPSPAVNHKPNGTNTTKMLESLRGQPVPPLSLDVPQKDLFHQLVGHFTGLQNELGPEDRKKLLVFLSGVPDPSGDPLTSLGDDLVDLGDISNTEGNTLLLRAVKTGQYDNVWRLLKKYGSRLDVNKPDRFGNACLHLAILQDSSIANRDTFLRRFNKNRNENGKNGKNGKNGQNGKNGKNGQNGQNGKNGQNRQNGKNGQNGNIRPNNRPDHDPAVALVKILLEHGADVHRKGKNGFSPLDLACLVQKADIARLLLEKMTPEEQGPAWTTAMPVLRMTTDNRQARTSELLSGSLQGASQNASQNNKVAFERLPGYPKNNAGPTAVNASGQ